MLPQLAGMQSWLQGLVASAIIMGIIALVVFLLIKRDFGVLAVVIILGGVLIFCVRNPESTIVKFGEGIVNKIMQENK
ncbi:hypothetical protein FI615_002205 [Enterococcus faecium]|nr:hypothetical protein [Enterococcus faecium]EMF0115485.1 hypothetical protein [Enterococcus hirae]